VRDSSGGDELKRWIFIVSSVVIVLDQLTKFLILDNLRFLPIEITPFFNFVLAWNRGISFGLLNQQTSWVFWALTIAAIIIVVGIFLYMLSQKSARKIIPLSMVMGGAIGNIIDRFWHGAVVDFLDFHLYNYHWPAFNVADSSIVVGVFLLMVDNYCDAKKQRPS
jgi:signal peptidase II